MLPFDNLSDDKEQGYLADGITEDLTTELARIPGLFVISRNAAFTYKGKAVQPAVIAKELGVRYLLEGSIRRVGDDIRINAQLIDGESSGHIWAERFDGAWADVFELQDEMVGQIATALKLRLVESQRAAQIAGGTSNPAAYDAWLRGLELESRGTPEDIAKAATSYQQAVALDPDYGRAWASLAWLYWNIHGPEQEKALGLTWPEIRGQTGRSLAGGRKASLSNLLSDTGGAPRSAAEVGRGDRRAGEGHRARFEQRLELRDDELGVDVQRAARGRARLHRRGGCVSTRRGTAGAITWRPSHTSRWIASTKPLRRSRRSNPQSREYGWFWTNFYGLMLGISAYGHLGQTDKIAALRERLDPMLKESDNGELTGQLAQTFFVFKNYADTERLLEGLRKAGVPELAWGFDPKSKDRLTGEEIRSLTFGHRFEGRLLNDWRTLFKDDRCRRLRPHHDRHGHNRRAQHDRGRYHLSEPGPDRRATRLLGDIPQPGRHRGAEERVPAVQPVEPLRVFRREGSRARNPRRRPTGRPPRPRTAARCCTTRRSPTWSARSSSSRRTATTCGALPNG